MASPKAVARFKRQPATTLYTCKVCRLSVKKSEVLVPPSLKGSNLVYCNSCADRPVCSTCEEAGTMNRKAPELQPGHSMFMETKLLVTAEVGRGKAKETGIICIDCLHQQQKIGFDIREVKR